MPDLVLDLRCLQDPALANRGVGRHALALLHGARDDPRLSGARLIGLADRELPPLAPGVAALLDRVRTTAYTGTMSRRTAFVALSPMTHDPLFTARLLHSPAPIKAAAVYDFIPLDAPDRYLGEPSQRLDYETRLRWLRRYDLYLPISEASAARLGQLVEAPAHAVAVTGAALDSAFIAGKPGRAEHLLVVGGEVRKNAEHAVRAHARSAAMQERRVPLVVLGHYDAAWLDAQRGAAASLGGRPQLVRVPGHVSEPELVALYRDALCVLAPSRDEGFSLPIIEAMASGVPVLASRIPAHEELLRDAACLFRVDDDEDLASRLDQVLDPAWRASQVAANDDTWRRFRADAVAARFWSPVAARLAAADAPAALRGVRPRLAVLSPLPPARSGVADYTASMCAELGTRAEVHLYTESPGAPLPSGAASVSPLSALPFLDSGFDRVIGVIGNSDHHLAVLRGLLRYGGAAICHDGRMLELYNLCLGPERTHRLAGEELGRALVPGEIDPWLTGTRPPGVLLLGELAAAAEPLMVHARATVREVRRRHGVEARHLPFCLYRPWSAEALGPAGREAARARVGVPPGIVLVATFGFTSAAKAPEDVLWAVEQLRAWGVPARLLYVGQTFMDLTPLRELAATLGMADHVDFGGAYADEQRYRDVLLAADVAVQLRTLGPGSVSGALADCVAAGLPTVASASLADALDAPSYVRAVPDSPSPVLVAEAARALLAEVPRAAVEPERIAYAAGHGFDIYAVRLLEALGLDP